MLPPNLELAPYGIMTELTKHIFIFHPLERSSVTEQLKIKYPLNYLI